MDNFLLSKNDKLSAEAKETIKAMVEYCLNHRLCLGMDEGFHENGNERGFVREIRELVKSNSI